MSKYMIHTYPKRLWYVNDFIIPSMLKQGIAREDIAVYNDEAGDGNLRACMKAFASVDDNEDGTWHLQDDVLICKDFKRLTERLGKSQTEAVCICGFSSKMYDGVGKIGTVPVTDAWFSFPCIYIPNQIARDCAGWVCEYIIGNPVYHDFWKNGVNDDWAFRLYLRTYFKTATAYNVIPNLVNHVDWLIGGGSRGARKENVVAQYWNDYDLLEELKDALDNYEKR